MEYREFIISEYLDQVKEIYGEEEWNSYLKDDAKLIRAFDNSLDVYGAFDNDKLVGFIRSVGDGEHILMIQDLIVRKDYQKKGIGTKLFKDTWNKYINVRMFHVVTDIHDKVDNKFYKSFGMKKLKKGNMVSYYR